MKMSKMGFKNVKLSNINEMYKGQDILLKTGQIKQYGSGVYAYDNIVLRVQDNIEKIIKKHFDEIDCVEVQMPLLQQKEIWQRSGRYDKYIEDEVMLTVMTNKGDYCLAPTAEEAITCFIENKVTSHKQLPVYLYQIGTKFRNEIRNRGYLYRGKEFNMFDLYTFDTNAMNMNNSYELVKKTYFKILEELKLKVIAVAADNGAIGGSKSEEIMVVSNSGEDTILYDNKKNIGLNIEILEKKDYQEYLKANYNIEDVSTLGQLKSIELGHIFALGDKYSNSMNIKYYDTENKLQNFWMGCYGIGVSRVLGVIYENNVIYENGDPIGFSLPLSVTPYYVYIIYNEDRKEEAHNLYDDFLKLDIDNILDDTNGSIGEKIRNAKVLGIPYIVIMGKNTENNMCEIEETKTNNKKIVYLEDVIIEIKTMIDTKKEIKF